MAQITFHGALQTDANTAFSLGPAAKAAGTNTELYHSTQTLAVGDILYTDPGYQTVFSGGGGPEFFYTSLGNKVVEISGADLTSTGGPSLGEVKSITLGPTYTIDFQDVGGNSIVNVNENVPFNIVVTETGSPSMTPVLTAGGQATAADFNSWPFTTNGATSAEELVLDFTLGTNPISVPLQTTADLTADGNESFSVQLTDGTLNNITIVDTSVPTTTTTTTTSTTTTTTLPPPAIAYDDNSAMSIAANNGQGTDPVDQNRTFTLTSANSPLQQAQHITFSASQTWLTVTLSQSTTSGGTLVFSADENISGGTRSVQVAILHPDNSSVTDQITVTQLASDVPTAPDYTVTITQDTNTTLDLDTASGYTPGTPPSDPTGQALTFQIMQVPSGGALIGNPQTGATYSQGDTVAANNLIQFVPPAGNTGQYSYTYRATDTDGNSDNGTVTIIVNPPANQAPQISDTAVAITVQGYGNTSDRTDQFNLGVVVSDEDPDTDLTWEFVDDANGTNPQAFSNRTLNNGTLTLNSGLGPAVFTYEYTGPTLNAGSTEPTPDQIWWRVTDTENETSVIATVTFTVTKPGNTAPSFPNTQANRNVDQYSSGTDVIAAADPNPGDTLTYSLVDQGGGNFFVGGGNKGSVSINSTTGAWVYEADFNVSGASEQVSFQITVQDQFGATAPTPLTVTYTVTAVSYLELGISSDFWNNSNGACSQPRTNSTYIDIAQATDITQLTTGDSLYIDSSLTTKFVPQSPANPWVSIQQVIAQNTIIKAVELDANGDIVSVINCTITTGSAWPLEVNYSNDVNDLCGGNYETATVWQNVADGYTLQQVVNASGQLFTSESTANLWSGGIAPAGLTVSPGFYNDNITAGAGFYFQFANGGWVADEQTNALMRICPAVIDYHTYSIQAYWNPQDQAKVIDVCAADESGLQLAQIYFRGDSTLGLDSLTEREKLLYVIRNQRVVYQTQEAANQQDYDLLWDTTTFIPAESDGNSGWQLPTNREWALFENDNSSGYTGNFRWIGVNDEDPTIRESATVDTILGLCTTGFTRPNPHTSFEVGGQLASRRNIFYAFYSCSARYENGVAYWPLYVVDGMHTANTGDTSYIKALLDDVGAGATIGGDTFLSCVTYVHKVTATNMEDAIDILSLLESDLDGNPGNGDEQTYNRIQSINAVDLGFTSGATVYKYPDCEDCLLNKPVDSANTFTLAIVDESAVINRSIPNFNLEKNYNLDDLSKPLLRTNPKLSTNVKLVVNSEGRMYLESIDATKELTSVEYKKWSLNKEGQWSYDLAKFFKSAKTPTDLMYAVKESFSNFAVQETYENQIEEDYHYGTVYNYSKLHDEDFRMFAPIWLDKNIPRKFVIFRVKDPVGTLDFDTRNTFDNIQEILTHSEIVKSFDLTRNSDLGTYIRNHVQSESFPKNPIGMNFDRTQRSTFNGIDMKKGGFTSKGEYLDSDFIKQDSTLISANDIITGGFERNNLACANIMNLEFLFNDDQASDYSVNRYFGLYVNDVDSGYGTLESANSGSLKFKSLNSYINSNAASAIPSFKMMDEMPVLGYASVSDKFYKISPKAFYDTSDFRVNVEDTNNRIPAEIKLAKTGNSIDIKENLEGGEDFVKVTVVDTPGLNDRFGIFPSKEQCYRLRVLNLDASPWPQPNINVQLRNPYTGMDQSFGVQVNTDLNVTVNNLNAGLGAMFFGAFQSQLMTPEERDAKLNYLFEYESTNTIILYEKKAALAPLYPRVTIQGLFAPTIARFEEMQVPYDLSNNTFSATASLPAGQFNSVNFSLNGTRSEIASAIVKSINSIDNGFTALTYDGADHFYIKSNVIGYKQFSAGIAVPNANAVQWISVDAANEDVNNRLRLADVQESSNLVGVALTNTNSLYNSERYFFSGGNAKTKSALVTLDSAEDVNIGDYIETKAKGVYNKVIDIVDDIERLPLQYKKLVLDKPNSLADGEVSTYADNIVRLGLFSAFDIHDMNFDFYDTQNSELKELKYETFQNISYEPEVDTSNDIYPFGDRDNTEYTLDPEDYFTGLSDVLTEENADEFNEEIITSEFDRLQENYLKEYAVRSRVVPAINKWVLKDALTVREQPYYLNANEAFGRTNFAPDLTNPGRDRLGMTHEWFYINNLPSYLKVNQGDNPITDPVYRLEDSFSYINFMDQFEIDPSIFKSTNYDYFDRFFVTEGFETRGQDNYKTFIKTNLQKKYSRVDGGNDKAFADTIFKGLKVTFKNRKEFTSSNPLDFVKSSEFNGYKFSVLLNVKTAQDSNGIEYEVIQNKKFKFVVFFITLSIDDLWADGTLNRKLLYELNHSLVWREEAQTFAYSDIKLDGSMDLQGLNTTAPSDDDYLILDGLVHQDGAIPQYLEQINKNENDEFGTITIKINSVFGPKYYQLNIAEVIEQDKLRLTQPPLDISDGVANAVTADLTSIPIYLQFGAEYTYVNGGVNAYKSILDSLSAKDVAEMLLRDPGNVQYTTIESDGTSSNNKFIILFEDGVEVVKESMVITVEDDDKPESFKLSKGNIGYNLAQGLTYYPFLIRHNGGYTVDTRPVVTFTDVYSHMKTNTLQSTSNLSELQLEEQMYKHSLTDADEIKLARDYYKRFNRCGVAFNLGFIYDGGNHDRNWGYIKNHFYRKVNEFNASSVTKLSTTTDKLPLYPLIGEIAIDKKDVHVFKSSWDKNYYTRALSGGGSELVPGTFETKEEKSYLSSTIMKIKDSYTMTQFSVETVNTEESLDDILINNTNETDLVVFEDDNRILVDFYLTTTVKKLLANDGVLATIQNYVAAVDSAEDKTTLKDDAELYIDENLLGLFALSQIKLYTSRIKGQASSLESSASIEALDDNGYKQDQNFTFREHEQKPLNFRLIYNKRLGYSYRIRPMIKITS